MATSLIAAKALEKSALPLNTPARNQNTVTTMAKLIAAYTRPLTSAARKFWP